MTTAGRARVSRAAAGGAHQPQAAPHTRTGITAKGGARRWSGAGRLWRAYSKQRTNEQHKHHQRSSVVACRPITYNCRPQAPTRSHASFTSPPHPQQVACVRESSGQGLGAGSRLLPGPLCVWLGGRRRQPAEQEQRIGEEQRSQGSSGGSSSRQADR